MAASTPPPKCGHCSARPPSLLLCTGCRRTHYCSRACQSSDRPRHKAVCSPRVLRIPSEDKYQQPVERSRIEQRDVEREESRRVRQLARLILETKIRPEVLREDVMPQLEAWLTFMLTDGPARPYNKIKHFERDILNDEDFTTDAELYVETLAGCHGSLIERNRRDERKRGRYPPPDSELRVCDNVLRMRCGTMVEDFAKRMQVSDESLKKAATEEFYEYYKSAILERPGYNSYTGLSAVFGDEIFMKQGREIVMNALGLSEKECKVENEIGQCDNDDIGVIVEKNAYPPWHTLTVFTIVMVGCVCFMPSLETVDEYATIETFTSSIFKEGIFHFTPLALGIVRMSFAIVCLVVTRAKWRRGVDLKLTYIPSSKLRGGRIQMSGWRTQGFFTAWSWNLLGVSFFFGGLIPLLVEYKQRSILDRYPWILRTALVSFEIAAPCALFISFIVTYSLWPTAYKTHGPEGTLGLKSSVSLFQHNVNSFMVLLELCLMGGLPVKLSHASFAPVYAGCYQIFMWCMAPYWVPDHGPVFLYFFVDTTLGKKTTYFMMGLLSVIFVSFLFFAFLEMGVSIIERGGHGVAPNLSVVFLISSLLMKHND